MNNERLQKLDAITLEHGSHNSPEAGMCAMELAAWLADEPHSDQPQCVDPIIATFLRSWNDSLGNEMRQKLKPYVVRSLNTRTTAEALQVRGLLAIDWQVRVFTSTWLELADLGDAAESLRALPVLDSWDAVVAATPTIQEAQKKASVATRDAAGSAAGNAARAAAWNAARAAAGSAAGNALAGTVTSLQASAFQLLNRMIEVTGGSACFAVAEAIEARGGARGK